MNETATETLTELRRISGVVLRRDPDGLATLPSGDRITWEALTAAVEDFKAQTQDATIAIEDGTITIDRPAIDEIRTARPETVGTAIGRTVAAMMPRLAADPGIELRAIAEAAPEPLEVTIERMPKPIDDPFGPRNRAERRKAAAEAHRSRKRKRR